MLARPNPPFVRGIMNTPLFEIDRQAREKPVSVHVIPWAAILLERYVEDHIDEDLRRAREHLGPLAR